MDSPQSPNSETKESPKLKNWGSKAPLDARAITRVVKVHEASEGIGSKVRRCVGNRSVRCLPPFVICEHFRMNELGRPPHPARGAQKITYVMSGKVRVEYSPANTIDLGPGDVTSLMVGKGVIRSVKAIASDENPGSKSVSSGIQIFMDVPEPFKRNNPSHLNLCHSDILVVEPSNGARVKILTGSAFGKKAEQMLTTTPALILDCVLEPGSQIEVPVKPDWNAFAYVIEGPAVIQSEHARRHAYVEFMRAPPAIDQEDSNKPEEIVYISVDSSRERASRILFCAAKPLCQPIYRQGPFVDVSMDWIHQAFSDYTERKNGFEAGQWNSHASRTVVPKPVAEKECDKDGKCWPYNPCETDNLHKASFPNSFPPGSINPASHSTEFNGVDCVEAQQESKIPKEHESKDSDNDDSAKAGTDTDTTNETDSERPIKQKRRLSDSEERESKRR